MKHTLPPMGVSRSRVTPRHALITPDTHVWAPLPGWTKSTAATHISPVIGARFSQSTVILESGAVGGPAMPGVERCIFVLEGRIKITVGGSDPMLLDPEMYAFLSADWSHQITASEPSRIVLFEKKYQPLPGVRKADTLAGSSSNIPAEPFMGDEAARLQVLLPAEPGFDMAVNLFTYQPGANLPQVEIHVMEHGLLMLDGAGVYRLGDDWYPVQAGDVIWMASYCPQWFVAMGKTPARYLYYKDVNRDPFSP